jgi:hypothetical protein
MRDRKQKTGPTGLAKAQLRKKELKAAKEESEVAEAESLGISVEELRRQKLREVQDIRSRKPAVTASPPAPEPRAPPREKGDGRIRSSEWAGYSMKK